MSFNSFAEFLSMGGHGLYVWLCYGTGLLVMLLTYILPVARRKSLMRELAQLQRRDRKNSGVSSKPDAANDELDQ